jgi:hypothetical protein
MYIDITVYFEETIYYSTVLHIHEILSLPRCTNSAPRNQLTSFSPDSRLKNTMPAHTNEPQSSSYSLNDLILAISFLEFVLSMAAAVLVRYHNGTVNDIVCVLGIAAMIPGLL